MDLYSIEKTKDYTFFKIVYYYYQLTPRTIRIIKTIGLLMLSSLFFVIYHFSKDNENICIYIYINIFIQIIIVTYLLELLMINLAKGTGNDRMIEVCNTLKDCNDSFMNGCSKVLKIYIFIFILIYIILNLIFKLPYPNILTKILSINILYFYSFVSIIIGSIVQYYLYYFNLWIGVIAITRASYHSTKNYNDYIRFTYQISLIITIVSLFSHFIIIGTIFITIYLLFFITEPDYYSYPYDKLYIFLLPYILGVILINLVMSLSGVNYSQSSKKCFEYINNIDHAYNIEINLGYHYNNPIYLSSLISDNILNIQRSMNSCLKILLNLLILMICSIGINNKTSILKKNIFLFPICYMTLIGVFEIIKLCFIRTRDALPLKGSIEYQDPETIIEVYSKGNWILGIFMFLIYGLISFLFFSDFNYSKMFNKSNNFWNNNNIFKKIELKNENSSKHKNIIWFYTCVIYIIGGIIFYFIKYFSKRYVEPSCPSIKNILNISNKGGITFNLFGSLINGVESEIFPLLIIFIIILNPFVFNMPFMNINIKYELGYYLQGLLLLKLNSYSLYINIINESKTIVGLTNSILSMTYLENKQIKLISDKIYKDITHHQQNILQVNHSISFITFYLLIYNIKYLYLNKLKDINDYNNFYLNNKTIKIDWNNPEIIVSGIMAMLFIKIIISILINNIFLTTELSILKLKTLFSSPIKNTNSLIQRTKIDYQQCPGIITQIALSYSYKLIVIITLFPFFLDSIFYIYGKYINNNNNNENISINCLIIFLYFLISYGLINSFFVGNASYSLINTNSLLCSDKINLENKDNLVITCKIGSSIGSFLKDTVESCISIITFYLLIIIINEIHIII